MDAYYVPLVHCLFLVACTSLCHVVMVTPPSTTPGRSEREHVGDVAAAEAEAAVAQVYESTSAETTEAIREAAHAATAAAAEAFGGEEMRLRGDSRGAARRGRLPPRGRIARGARRGRGAEVARGAGREDRQAILLADKLVLIELKDSGRYTWAHICVMSHLPVALSTAREIFAKRGKYRR